MNIGITQGYLNQGCQVWPFQINKFGPFLTGWPRNLRIFKVVGLFLVYRSLYSKIQDFSFLRTEFGIFQSQAPGNPDLKNQLT